MPNGHISDIDPGSNCESTELLAEMDAFQTRMGTRSTREARAMQGLLRAAREIAERDAGKARLLFERSCDHYAKALNKENQMWHFFGAMCAVICMALAATYLAGIKDGSWGGAILANLTKPQQLVSLVYFACTGAIASMILRLPSIDMGNDERRIFVFFTGFLPPLLAICFAGAVQVILSTGVVSISIGSAPVNVEANTWVAAFLCGFSEKFAPNLLAIADAAETRRQKRVDRSTQTPPALDA